METTEVVQTFPFIFGLFDFVNLIGIVDRTLNSKALYKKRIGQGTRHHGPVVYFITY